MTAVTAIAALIISIASFAFSIYQYRSLHLVRVGEKTSALQRLSHELRRKTADLKHKIDSTDDMDDCSDLFAKVDPFLEEEIAKLLASKKMTLSNLLKIEKELLALELEIDLFHRQVEDVRRFNDEVRVYESSKLERQ